VQCGTIRGRRPAGHRRQEIVGARSSAAIAPSASIQRANATVKTTIAASAARCTSGPLRRDFRRHGDPPSSRRSARDGTHSRAGNNPTPTGGGPERALSRSRPAGRTSIPARRPRRPRRRSPTVRSHRRVAPAGHHGRRGLARSRVEPLRRRTAERSALDRSGWRPRWGEEDATTRGAAAPPERRQERRGAGPVPAHDAASATRTAWGGGAGCAARSGGARRSQSGARRWRGAGAMPSGPHARTRQARPHAPRRPPRRGPRSPRGVPGRGRHTPARRRELRRAEEGWRVSEARSVPGPAALVHPPTVPRAHPARESGRCGRPGRRPPPRVVGLTARRRRCPCPGEPHRRRRDRRGAPPARPPPGPQAARRTRPRRTARPTAPRSPR
jgi:hypothetical protein